MRRGQFALSVPGNAVLTFSFVGYTDQTCLSEQSKS